MTNPTMGTSKNSDSACTLIGVAGISLVVAGLTANSWTLGYLLTLDGAIDSRPIRLSILALDALAIVAGALLYVNRKTVQVGNLVLLPVSLTVALLVASGACQVVCSPNAIISGWRAQVGILEQNDLGFRGHEIAYSDDDYVILLVGDSHVEAVACSFDYMPAIRLEHHLNAAGKRVKVFSLGAGGYGQDQQLLALREYYSNYRADFVLLWQTPSNDVWNNTWPTHWPTNGNPKPTFWLEDGELQGPTEHIGGPVALPRIRILAMFGPYLRSVRQRDTLWEARLPSPYRPLANYTGPVNMRWQQHWDEDVGSMRVENFDNDKNHFAIALTPPSERITYGLELTRRLIQEMEAVARRNGSDFLIFTVDPLSESMSESEVFSLHGNYYHVSKKQYLENMEYINGDFAFADIYVTLENWRVGPYDNHFNEHATDEAMLRLARVMADRF